MDISQDLGNSTLEFYAIAEALGREDPGPNGVLELGAGYGRLAWLYLAAFPRLRYLIVDIPPALALSQEYLTRLFPRQARRFGFDISTRTLTWELSWSRRSLGF